MHLVKARNVSELFFMAAAAVCGEVLSFLFLIKFPSGGFMDTIPFRTSLRKFS